jgi:ABC-type transport system involved in multi-copper enzyme maturation permease subunit
MHVSGLSPFGPIFGKELRVASRRKRNYLLRVLYLGAVLLILLWAWAITRNVYAYGSVSARQQQQEQLGFFFFAFFGIFSVIAMSLVGAVVASTAINVEKEQKTLHVLLMTPLTAWQIVAGKLFSRLLTALTLLGLSLPVLALVRLLGGVELDQMFGVVAMAIVMAMTSAALALLLSIFVQRAYAVILLSYLLMGLAYVFAPMMMLIWASGTGRRGSVAWFRLISSYNPIWCTIFLSTGQMRMLLSGWQSCVYIHLGVTAVLLMLSAFALRRWARREGESASSEARPAQISQSLAVVGNQPAEVDAMLLASGPLLAPQPPSRMHGNRDVGDNPILWRELRRPLMVNTWQRVAGALVCVGLMLFTYIMLANDRSLDKSENQIGYAVVFHTLLMLLAGVIAATAIAGEKESDTWTILLVSPVSGANVIWSKAAGVARRLLWPVAGIAFHFAIFTATGVITPVTLMLIMVVLITFNVVWIATGVTLSLLCRKVTVAVIINLALPLVAYGVVAILLAVFDELFRIDNGNLPELVTWYLPYYYLGEGISRGNVNYSPQLPGHHSGTHVTQMEFLCVAIFFGLLYIAASAGILAFASAMFNRAVGRAPQIDPLAPLQRSTSHTPSWAPSAT